MPKHIIPKPKKALEVSVTEVPFLMIPPGDRQLVRKHGLGLQDYWLDCWEADCYGSRYILMPDADLKSTTQAKYRKQLEELRLFMFEVRKQKNDRQLWVLNLHGSRVKNFWKPIAKTLDQNEQSSDVAEQTLDDSKETLDRIEQIEAKTQSEQEFQSLSTSFINSSKE